MAAESEIIFESYLRKLTTVKSNSLSFRKPWKKRYYVLSRLDVVPRLLEYDSKPINNSARPREEYILSANYSVYKRGRVNGKNFVCEILLQNGVQLFLAVNDNEESIYHLFAFFLSIQAKLRSEYERECMKVRPDNTVEMEHVGARGNMCLLHVSKWGITLVLEVSKAVLAQWPLNSIRAYESTGKGQFLIEAGSRSPTGEGKYVFNTRYREDDVIYDSLDRAVAEGLGLLQLVSSRSSGHSVDMLETSHSQLIAMQSMTEVVCDPQFVAHHKKVARTIYDQMAQHIGSARASNSFSSSAPINLSASSEQLSPASPVSVSAVSLAASSALTYGSVHQRSMSERKPVPTPAEWQYLHPISVAMENSTSASPLANSGAAGKSEAAAAQSQVKPPMMRPIVRAQQQTSVHDQYIDMRFQQPLQQHALAARSLGDIPSGSRNTYVDNTYHQLADHTLSAPGAAVHLSPTRGSVYEDVIPDRNSGYGRISSVPRAARSTSDVLEAGLNVEPFSNRPTELAVGSARMSWLSNASTVTPTNDNRQSSVAMATTPSAAVSSPRNSAGGGSSGASPLTPLSGDSLTPTHVAGISLSQRSRVFRKVSTDVTNIQPQAQMSAFNNNSGVNNNPRLSDPSSQHTMAAANAMPTSLVFHESAC